MSEQQPQGVLLSDDLLFASRITTTARAEECEVKIARAPETLLAMAREQEVSCVLLDLQFPGFALTDFLSELRQARESLPYLVAYGSHVDAQSLKAAREAGCDVVLPRSAFVEQLPLQIREWIHPSS